MKYYVLLFLHILQGGFIMTLILLLEKMLPRKFINTSHPQAAVDTHERPVGCFKSGNQGPYLRSPDGRVIPLPKARFLKRNTEHKQH